MYKVEQFQEMVELAIGRYSATLENTAPHNLYKPVSYGLSVGGKRLRPVMVLLAYQLFGNFPDKILPAGMAIEVFHNFTLLHDDIMDKADLRRNQQTVHKMFSENNAILSGDAMAFLAYKFLLDIRSSRLPEVLELFTTTAIEVCEGQQYDMDFEGRSDVTSDEYLEMIKLKTAVLLGCAFKTGALLGDADDSVCSQLYNVGLNLGMAFQLQDDLLDTYGDEAIFGKKLGGDIVSNKKTWLLIKAFENAGTQHKAELEYWIGKEQFDRQEKINGVRSVFNALHIKEITQNEIISRYNTAIGLLNRLQVDDERKAPLLNLCEKLVKRNL